MPQHTTSNFKRPPRACAHCGELFQPLNDTKRFCSRRCYGNARTCSVVDRFWRYVQKTSTCWIWTGGRNKQNYGRIGVSGRMVPAHRVSWELHNGAIPNGLFVCHTCDNPPCVNPTHLWLGTTTDNARDMAAKGRQAFQRDPSRAARGIRNGNYTHPESRPKGERHHRAKLTDDDVRAIRIARTGGQTIRSIAADYDVTEATIKRIVYRKNWKHI